MRTIEASLFLSVDGVAESPNLWMENIYDPDMMTRMSAAIADIDTVVLGRTTYEQWSGYWPTSTDEPYASFINKTPKFVVSSTLEAAPWGSFAPAQIIAGDVIARLAELKRQPGKTIGVQGSISLVESLLRAGLLDRLTLMTFPVLAGRGKRLFQEGALQRLRLVSAEHSDSGVLYTAYGQRT